MCFTNNMKQIKKKQSNLLASQPDFEEIDHRLACGWHAHIEGSGQRKRYLRAVSKEKFSSISIKKD